MDMIYCKHCEIRIEYREDLSGWVRYGEDPLNYVPLEPGIVSPDVCEVLDGRQPTTIVWSDDDVEEVAWHIPSEELMWVRPL